MVLAIVHTSNQQTNNIIDGVHDKIDADVHDQRNDSISILSDPDLLTTIDRYEHEKIMTLMNNIEDSSVPDGVTIPEVVSELEIVKNITSVQRL